MTDHKKFKYSMRELTEMLVKHEGLTEGKWMLSVEFGITATNLGPDSENLTPAAVVPIVNVGLIESDKINNLTVDAATYNKRK